MEKKTNPENFLKLDKEKQRKILSAAFTAFGENGYDKTSMADIADLANVSKSSLFHYFKSKKNFYLYLYQFSGDLIENSIFNKIDNTKMSDDFFERIMFAQNIKLSVMSKYPGMYEFLTSTIKDSSKKIHKEIGNFEDEYKDITYEKLFGGIDWSKFKENADKEKVFNMLKWIIEGQIKKSVRANKNIETIIKEAWEYINLLKEIAYKEEYLKDGK